MTNLHGSFIWYELITPDPAAAKGFYDDVVGWSIDAEASNPMDYRMIDAGDGQIGGVLTLTAEMTANGARPAWIGYIGVDDVDTTVAAIEAAGGAVHMPAFDIPGAGRMAMVSDPQGAPFYVMRGASDQSSGAFDQARQRHCAWNELATTDQDAAIRFYSRLFGWENAGSMPMGDLGEYTFLKSGESGFGAVMNRVDASMPPVWVFYFNLDGIDAAVDRIKAAGGSIIQAPIEIPGGSFSILASDPHGAVFGLVGSRS